MSFVDVLFLTAVVLQGRIEQLQKMNGSHVQNVYHLALYESN